jgi:hypothetical protein
MVPRRKNLITSLPKCLESIVTGGDTIIAAFGDN